jgi:hypothetical protein
MISTNSQSINERVKVVMAFSVHATPLLLEWRGRRIKIKRLNSFFPKKIGRKLVYYFFASDSSDNGYKLLFDTTNLHWELEEITY